MATPALASAAASDGSFSVLATAPAFSHAPVLTPSGKLSKNGGKLNFLARYFISVLLSASNSVDPIGGPAAGFFFLV
jgi:hypothetical protein